LTVPKLKHLGRLSFGEIFMTYLDVYKDEELEELRQYNVARMETWVANL